MANESMQMSIAGLSALRQREGAVFRYYNDAANNSSYGIGTLAHHGPCAADELRRPVSPADVDTQLMTHIRSAERAVKQHVRDHQLTQDQFDALVIFTYNVGAHGARGTLNAANRGAWHEVASVVLHA